MGGEGPHGRIPGVSPGAEPAVYLGHDVLAVRREDQGQAEPQAKETHGQLVLESHPGDEPEEEPAFGVVVLEDAKDNVGAKAPEKQIEGVHRV